MTIGNVNYNSSVITCGMADLQLYMKVKDNILLDRVNQIPSKLNMKVIQNSILNIANFPDGNLLHVNTQLSQNFNYCSVLSPSYMRYVGLNQENYNKTFAVGEKDNESYPKVNLTISKDPNQPAYILKNELSVRTRRAGYFMDSNTKKPYELKYMFYFEAEFLESDRNRVINYVKSAQAQITYLALIIIIIICAIVMCISFR